MERMDTAHSDVRGTEGERSFATPSPAPLSAVAAEAWLAQPSCALHTHRQIFCPICLKLLCWNIYADEFDCDQRPFLREVLVIYLNISIL